MDRVIGGSMPEISVIMPVHNPNAEYFKESVSSILNQSFSDFELLIIDDDSDISISELLSEFCDKRIRILRNKKNLGIASSLNYGITEAKGKYIARMDGDDISMPNRFQKQYSYMEKNPKISLCGTYTQKFYVRDNQKIKIKNKHVLPYTYKNNMDLFEVSLLFSNPGPMHPTAFFRKSFLDEKGLKW